MTDFVEYTEKKLLPEWAKGELGARLFGAVSVLFNALADQQTRAVCAGLIASPHSPDDALPFAGKERGDLWRIPGETIEQYRDRIIHAVEIWDYAAADKAILDALATAGFTGATITYHADRQGPRGEGMPYYSQFWVRIPLTVLQARPGWTAQPKWGSVVWGSFWWGTGGLSLEDARLFFSLVNKFKPADHVCRGIELA